MVIHSAERNPLKLSADVSRVCNGDGASNLVFGHITEVIAQVEFLNHKKRNQKKVTDFIE